MTKTSLKIRAALAASMLAAACSGGAASNGDTNAPGPAAIEPANTAAPVENAVAPAAEAPASAFTADYMVGKWSAVDEDCSSTIDFAKDGTVATPIGTAKWKVDGDKLSFDYGDGSKPTVSTIKVLTPDRIEIVHQSGTKETEKRC